MSKERLPRRLKKKRKKVSKVWFKTTLKYYSNPIKITMPDGSVYTGIVPVDTELIKEMAEYKRPNPQISVKPTEENFKSALTILPPGV